MSSLQEINKKKKKIPIKEEIHIITQYIYKKTVYVNDLSDH